LHSLGARVTFSARDERMAESTMSVSRCHYQRAQQARRGPCTLQGNGAGELALHFKHPHLQIRRAAQVIGRQLRTLQQGQHRQQVGRPAAPDRRTVHGVQQLDSAFGTQKAFLGAAPPGTMEVP
jgi:hypothetical protein